MSTRPTAPPTATPRDEWPAWAEMIASQSKPGEKGVGDTLERLISLAGGNMIKSAAEAIRRKPCRCSKRRDAMNARFPYVAVAAPQAPRYDQGGDVTSSQS